MLKPIWGTSWLKKKKERGQALPSHETHAWWLQCNVLYTYRVTSNQRRWLHITEQNQTTSQRCRFIKKFQLLFPSSPRYMKRPILAWIRLLKYDVTLEVQNRTIVAMGKLEPTQLLALPETLHKSSQPLHKKLHHDVTHASHTQQWRTSDCGRLHVNEWMSHEMSKNVTCSSEWVTRNFTSRGS